MMSLRNEERMEVVKRVQERFETTSSLTLLETDFIKEKCTQTDGVMIDISAQTDGAIMIDICTQTDSAIMIDISTQTDGAIMIDISTQTDDAIMIDISIQTGNKPDESQNLELLQAEHQLLKF